MVTIAIVSYVIFMKLIPNTSINLVHVFIQI